MVLAAANNEHPVALSSAPLTSSRGNLNFSKKGKDRYESQNESEGRKSGSGAQPQPDYGKRTEGKDWR